MERDGKQRERAQFNVLQKIVDERLKRGWSEYALAQNAGMTQSTISTWYRRGYDPTIASVEKICNGYGMTLSQFFDDGTVKNGLNEEQQTLLTQFERLSPGQRKTLLALMSAIATPPP